MVVVVVSRDKQMFARGSVPLSWCQSSVVLTGVGVGGRQRCAPGAWAPQVRRPAGKPTPTPPL